MSEATAPGQQQPIFNIEKLYVKDLSLEVPHAPGIFLEREQPQIELQLHSQAASIGENVFEVTITVTVTAKLLEKSKTMFLIEVKEAGIFQIHNVLPQDMDQLLGVTCPNIIYPYLREVVSDVAVRAGFAPVTLNPVNFETLYQQQKQQQVQAAPAVTH